MTFISITPLILISFVSVLGLLGLMLRFAEKLPLDHPVMRSLHQRPIPRVGGIGILAGVGVVVIASEPSSLHGMLYLALGLAIFSLLDDVRGLPVLSRLAIQIITATVFLVLYAPPEMRLPQLVFVALSLIWSTNLYNFMDGSDGMAAGMAVFGFGTYAVAAMWGNDAEIMVLSITVSTSALAFLWFNFHPARIFMGDVGSITLGFVAAAIGCVGYWRGLWSWTFPFMAFLPFVMDATVTLTRRVLRGDKFWQGHNTHYYQRLVRLGFGHRHTALCAYMLMALSMILALWMSYRPAYTVPVLVVAVSIHLVMMYLVDRWWSTAVALQGGSDAAEVAD